jgi:hypothetical protein
MSFVQWLVPACCHTWNWLMIYMQHNFKQQQRVYHTRLGLQVFLLLEVSSNVAILSEVKQCPQQWSSRR